MARAASSSSSSSSTASSITSYTTLALSDRTCDRRADCAPSTASPVPLLGSTQTSGPTQPWVIGAAEAPKFVFRSWIGARSNGQANQPPAQQQLRSARHKTSRPVNAQSLYEADKRQDIQRHLADMSSLSQPELLNGPVPCFMTVEQEIAGIAAQMWLAETDAVKNAYHRRAAEQQLQPLPITPTASSLDCPPKTPCPTPASPSSSGSSSLLSSLQTVRSMPATTPARLDQFASTTMDLFELLQSPSPMAVTHADFAVCDPTPSNSDHRPPPSASNPTPPRHLSWF
ncbi:hypothetical protein BC831DRAFT_473094 [Entophlyctis helioformis]|nr:hypothetical protein BC831DRAFT_473094 [Entophlyctis helioformis]